MKVPFVIYIRSVGIYALITLPTMVMPIMYMISIFYVLFFGWFAWALFTIIYMVVDKTVPDYYSRVSLLFVAIPLSVAFAFQMIEVFQTEENIWNAGALLLFPLAGVISGWISLAAGRREVRKRKTPVLELDGIKNNSDEK